MAKALIGHLASDLRLPARLAADNQRLRSRVADLEALVERLQSENDALVSASADRLLDVDTPTGSMHDLPVQEMLPA